MPTIRVLVADGHALLREGVTSVLATQPDMRLVAEAGDGADAMRAFAEHLPDVCLVDLQLPGGGLTTIAEMHRLQAQARIVAMTPQRNDPQALRALEAGACGYLLKSMLRHELVETVRGAYAGLRFAPDAAGHAAGAARGFEEHLSGRELEVLRAAAGGNPNKRIAVLLGISEETVKAHMRNILSKLGAHDRTHAVTIALRRGLLEV